MNKRGKKPKPSEYPDIVLKALVREYDSNLEIRSNGMAEDSLAGKAGVVDDYTEEIIPSKNRTYGPFQLEMHAAIRLLEDAKYVTAAWSGSDTLIKPTYEGLDHARWLMRPWYRKISDHFKGDIRTIVIAVVIALLTTLLIHWIPQLLGW